MKQPGYPERSQVSQGINGAFILGPPCARRRGNGDKRDLERVM